MNNRITRMKYIELLEKLKIVRLRLPKKSQKFSLAWNSGVDHNLFERIKERTGLPRNTVVPKIVGGIDNHGDKMDNKKSYALNFKKSGFKTITEKDEKTMLVVTLLSKDMASKRNDSNIDLDEEYKDIIEIDIDA